MKMILLLW